jgi:hypothetical protein
MSWSLSCRFQQRNVSIGIIAVFAISAAAAVIAWL